MQAPSTSSRKSQHTAHWMFKLVLVLKSTSCNTKPLSAKSGEVLVEGGEKNGRQDQEGSENP